SAEQLAEIAWMATQEVQRFGLPPKVAFLSHSSYGSSKRASARKMRAARDIFVALHPEIECDGELHGDAALVPAIRDVYLPDSSLTGSANLLICPNLDSANILYNVLKTTTSGGVTVGPILMGSAATAYILTPAATVLRGPNMTARAPAGPPAARGRRVLNMPALAAAGQLAPRGGTAFRCVRSPGCAHRAPTRTTIAPVRCSSNRCAPFRVFLVDGMGHPI